MTCALAMGLYAQIPAGDAQPCPGVPTVTDHEGNVYTTVKIGNQCWMRENMRTTHYADGVEIPAGSDTSTTIAFRYNPNNNSDNVANYGYLYNWPAVMHGAGSSSANPSGVQGICPTGWHLPSYDEWNTLLTALNDSSATGTKLKSQSGWNDNGNGTNVSGFSALPAGFWNYTFDNFYGDGNHVSFWSSKDDQSYAYYLRIGNDYARLGDDFKNMGLSVRCLKD